MSVGHRCGTKPSLNIDPKPSLNQPASICFGVSGSVAAVKVPQIVRSLLQRGISIDLVLTESACKLLHARYRESIPWDELQQLVSEHGSGVDKFAGIGTYDDLPATPRLTLWRDADEWGNYGSVGDDPVLHVELAKRNQALLIAPLCANTLASAAVGWCGSLLACVLRAWYYDLDPIFANPLAHRFGAQSVNRPVIVAPAMNTIMYHQRITSTHLDTLTARGVHVVPAVSKLLACGDTGMGAMAPVEEVVEVTLQLLNEHLAATNEAAVVGKPVFRV
eukprot:CAMPEP_0183354368 /NCGR_PEP_ID=MMETSP0164_2-20130417/37268_1 /TAXON_ID=221442 /ORGANISM="Coccolithus pelagicus ssp braarudi, Strain PLY182g" /LENGTH=276 /DNA_ID=CAMNT_0025527237 /DNA_START=54 /DNA_END=884 /DNA_ORIENTATION=+